MFNKNSFGSAQFALKGSASSVTLTSSNLTLVISIFFLHFLILNKSRGCSVYTIPSANVTLFRQRFIDFSGHSDVVNGRLPAPENSPTSDGNIPEPLVPLIDPFSPGRNVAQVLLLQNN